MCKKLWINSRNIRYGEMKQTDKDKTMEGRYRQFAGCDTLKASAKLSVMRDAGLLEMKGMGKATYYVPGDRFPIAKH